MAAAVAVASSFSLPGWGGNMGISFFVEVRLMLEDFIVVKPLRVLLFELVVRCCLITASAFLFSLFGAAFELVDVLLVVEQ